MQITKRYKIKYYYIGIKWEKHKRLKKSNVVNIFAGVYKFLQPSPGLQNFVNFAGAAKFCNPCEFGKVAYASFFASAFAFFYAL